MATTKKPAAKRASVKKAPVKKTVATHATKAKAATTKKAAPRKSTAKRTVRSTQASMRSFHIAQDQPPFTSFKITKQTVYWIILVAFIIFAQLWIIKLQVDVANLIEVQQNEFLDTF